MTITRRLWTLTYTSIPLELSVSKVLSHETRIITLNLNTKTHTQTLWGAKKSPKVQVFHHSLGHQPPKATTITNFSLVKAHGAMDISLLQHRKKNTVHKSTLNLVDLSSEFHMHLSTQHISKTCKRKPPFLPNNFSCYLNIQHLSQHSSNHLRKQSHTIRNASNENTAT